MNKDFLLNESKTFCMLPWVHINTTPAGSVQPCCIMSPGHNLGTTTQMSLDSAINCSSMRNLRLDMLNGITNSMCQLCYSHEKQGIKSFRQSANLDWGEYVDVVDNTGDDGSIENFKMRYFDIRFSNICNFKCRTCNSDFSSQWEIEDKKFNVSYARGVPKNNSATLVSEIISQIPNIKMAYFAGGEPLITEEHYILLEEMIRADRTDIELRYNTNLSNLKFKDKDLMGLWRNFKNKVRVQASIDHYGERAEYIRHGTDWAMIEDNLNIIRSAPQIIVQLNTVVSVFNCLTLHDFYSYLIDRGLYVSKDYSYLQYHMSGPSHYSCHILPDKYKKMGVTNLNKAIDMLKKLGFDGEKQSYFAKSIDWLLAGNTWNENKDMFRTEIKRLDTIRGEQFTQVFPELAGLIDE